MNQLNRSNQFWDQIKWEMLNCEIRCFTIKFLKALAKAKKIKQYSLENKLNFFDSNLNCDIMQQNKLTVKINLKKFMLIMLKALK